MSQLTIRVISQKPLQEALQDLSKAQVKLNEQSFLPVRIQDESVPESGQGEASTEDPSLKIEIKIEVE